MPTTQNRYHKSSKETNEDLQQRRINEISSSIDFNKLKKQDSLSVDKNGHVNINSKHPS